MQLKPNHKEGIYQRAGKASEASITSGRPNYSIIYSFLGAHHDRLTKPTGLTTPTQEMYRVPPNIKHENRYAFSWNFELAPRYLLAYSYQLFQWTWKVQVNGVLLVTAPVQYLLARSSISRGWDVLAWLISDTDLTNLTCIDVQSSWINGTCEGQYIRASLE